MLGTSVPSMKSALPIPVPNVSSRTVPLVLRPAPNRTSASPAASASLSTATGTPQTFWNSLRASVPRHDSSMLAAVSTTPFTTRPGTVQPMGPSQSVAFMISWTVLATSLGVAGWGVGMR